MEPVERLEEPDQDNIVAIGDKFSHSILVQHIKE